MDKRGQITVGVILMGFLTVLVGLILLQGSFPFIGQTVNTFTLANRTFTFPATGGTIDLVGQELINTPGVINRSNGVVVPASNYTIAERISTVDGLKRIALTANAGFFNNQVVNVSYDYGSEGYIDDAGGRATTNLIPLMGVLALLCVAIGMVIKEKFF